MVKIDDDTIFNPFVFKEVFQPNFIANSAELAVMIGRAVEGNPVRISETYEILFRIRVHFNTFRFSCFTPRIKLISL